jgi:hypothetical protein
MSYRLTWSEPAGVWWRVGEDPAEGDVADLEPFHLRAQPPSLENVPGTVLHTCCGMVAAEDPEFAAADERLDSTADEEP